MGSPIIQDVIDKMTKAKTVEEGAIAFISGVPAKIEAAVAAAQANGATAEELQPVSDLATALDSDSDALQAALTANT